MRRLNFLLNALAMFAITIVYPFARLWGWLDLYSVWGTPVLLIALAVPLLMTISRFMFRIPAAWLRSGFVLTWLGLCFILFPIVLIGEILNLTTSISTADLGIGVLITWLAVGCYSLVNAHRIQLNKVQVRGTDATRGMSVVQISDVHIGSKKPEYLSRIVKRIRRLNPSLVAITGDLVDSSKITERDLSALRDIADICYFTTGNHERYEDCEAIVRWLRNLGVTVLRNESIDAQPFQLVGIDDSEASDKVAKELLTLTPLDKRYKILLYHRPQGMRSAAEWGMDLMLSGHTHHGQIFPFNFVVKRFFSKTRGTHRYADMLLHVNTGTGTWGPKLRLGSTNQITQLIFV